MTIPEFILLHTTGVLNFNSWMNVLYNPVGNNQGKIEAITVTLNAAAYNGITVPPTTNIETVLEQVETISFTFDAVEYTLTVDSKTIYTGENPFYLFLVTSDTLVPDLLDADLANPQYGTIVTFEPFLSQAIFNSSDYNVIINNGTNFRKHPIKLIADREGGFANPTNFAAILSTSASKAEVQESFYTSTGITNARYKGTLTDATDYAGISPSFSAREFTGEIFPADANRDHACGLLNSDRVLIDMLHTGPTFSPAFISGSTDLRLFQDLQPESIVIPYVYIPGGQGAEIAKSIEAGDLILNTATDEIMKVRFHNKFNKILQVTRGYLQTTPIFLEEDTELFKISRTDLIRLDEFRSDLTSVGNSIVYVQENNNLLYTDDYGTVYSSSLCPDPLLLGIDDGSPP